MRHSLVVLFALAGCTGPGTNGHARSAAMQVNGPDCRSACQTKLQGGEVLADCTPAVENDPRRRDPWTTVCFYDATK